MKRYQSAEEQELLQLISLVDPRVPSLAWLDEYVKERAYDNLQKVALKLGMKSANTDGPGVIKSEPDEDAAQPAVPALPSIKLEPGHNDSIAEPLAKKQKIAEDSDDEFDDVLVVKVCKPTSHEQQVEDEIKKIQRGAIIWHQV